MLRLVPTAQFKKDYKRAKKRGLPIEKLQQILDLLREGKPLPERNRDHALTGSYAGFRECHIQPDWLLVYAVQAEELILVAARTGTHADLFGK